MEQYIQISKINDFLYCPLSLYLHTIYENFNEKTYHTTPQVVGRMNHHPIDTSSYSTSKKYLQGMPVYSQQYGIAGKIDIYDQDKNILIERKTRIKRIYKGYVYQLYAQMLCIKEMGYEVDRMYIHSLENNKRYEILLPSKKELREFHDLLDEIHTFNIEQYRYHRCPKCQNSIYGLLAW